jgi:flagellin-specific chaperone FliS
MMRGILPKTIRKSVLLALGTVLTLLGPASGQQAPSTSAEHESKANPVVRTFGAEGGYRTEVRSETHGTLSQDDRRQVSLLAAQVFQHVDEARKAIDADDTTRAHKEVDKGKEAIQAIRALLPRTSVHTRTTAPDGKVIYEDEREVQEDQVPLYEGMVQARTLAPILAARRDSAQIAGVRVVESEAISTAVTADLDLVEAQLARAAKALDDKKTDDAAAALLLAQVQGVDIRYNKEDTPLAEARDAIWLAKRALEENNAAQARANLAVARTRLELYRQILPEDRRGDVTQMLSQVNQMEAQLRKEANQPSDRAERTRQGNAVTHWWDEVNQWFKKRF